MPACARALDFCVTNYLDRDKVKTEDLLITTTLMNAMVQETKIDKYRLRGETWSAQSIAEKAQNLINKLDAKLNPIGHHGH